MSFDVSYRLTSVNRPVPPPKLPGVERVWWERTLLVLRRPAGVFAALRGEDDGSRSEPLLAIVFLAGIAGVLGTNAFSHASTTSSSTG